MRWEACVLVATLLAAPLVAARESDEPREERTTILVLLTWGPDNVGMTNFSREDTTPPEALASFSPDVVRALAKEWQHDPRVTAADVQAASAAVLDYCMAHNAHVFRRLVDERLTADLHLVAPGARVANGPDGLGLAQLERVPVGSIDAILRLSYVANVGHADAGFTPDDSTTSAAPDAKANAAT
jgi:hypothetical protein